MLSPNLNKGFCHLHIECVCHLTKSSNSYFWVSKREKDGKTTWLRPEVGSFFNPFYHLKILILSSWRASQTRYCEILGFWINHNPDWLSKFKDQGILSYWLLPSFLLLTMIVNRRIVIVVLESQFHKAWTNQGLKPSKIDSEARRLGSCPPGPVDNHSVWVFFKAVILIISLFRELGSWAALSTVHAIGAEYLTRAINVLDWGHIRGVVFELNFIRGVKQQHLMFMQQVSSPGYI